MSSQIVTYVVGDSTTASFEIELGRGFEPASRTDEVAGRVKEAIAPAIAAASEVLGQVQAASPDEVSLTFGIKVSGTANWWVAKAATEGNFQVTLKWNSGSTSTAGEN